MSTASLILLAVEVAAWMKGRVVGIRVTIRQIGWSDRDALVKNMRKSGHTKIVQIADGTQMTTLEGLGEGEPLSTFEREDDWCATAYFYIDKPVDELPAIEPYAARVKGLLAGK